MSGDAGAIPECEMEKLMAPDHIALQMRSSGQG